MRVVFVGKQRVIWKLLLLYILTLGIRRRVWLYRVNKEVDGHAALGINHRLNLFLLILPIIGPFIVQCKTTGRLNNDLHSDVSIKYGPTALLCLLQVIPILGNLFYLGWTQDRLNVYWRHERNRKDQGIELDVGLEEDPQFLIELEDARVRSYKAGSRFDRKKVRRREEWAQRMSGLAHVGEERRAVRQAGGSVPVLPWRRPARPTHRRLNVTCGRCDHAFQVHQDPTAETIVLCPKCGLNEVIPSLRGDPLKDSERGGVPAIRVDCPDCKNAFHAVRALEGPTDLVCPHCGKEDQLPAPKPGEAAAPAKKPAKKPAAKKAPVKATKAKTTAK